MKILIDYSVMCHLSWHCMRSPNYEARTDIEISEFSRTLAGNLLYYKERFKPEEIILALDSREGYWRHDIVKKYYEGHTKIYKYFNTLEDKTKVVAYGLQFDGKSYVIDFFSAPKKWIIKKLTKGELSDLAQTFSTKNQIKYSEAPEKILKFVPTYKGNRKTSSWDYSTTREEWHNLCEKIAYNLAYTLGAKVISTPKAEADDIAKVYSDVHSSEDMVFITTDSDWSQLLIDTMFLKIYIPSKREWLDITPEQAELDLATKIIAGDTSDNISAVNFEGQANVGPAKAKALIIEHGVSGIYDYLAENAQSDSLNKNYQLIFLNNIPSKLEKQIRKTLETTKVVKKNILYPLSKYGLEPADIISISAQAKLDIEIDTLLGKE